MTDDKKNENVGEEAEMRCEGCTFSELQTPTGATVTIGQRVRICRFNPPTTVMVPEEMKDQTGKTVGASLIPRSVFPFVADDWYCYQFEEREGMEIEPTALTPIPRA